MISDIFETMYDLNFFGLFLCLLLHQRMDFCKLCCVKVSTSGKSLKGLQFTPELIL